MKASELRIGNFVQGAPMSVPRLEFVSDGVQAIQSMGIHLVDTGQWTPEPIPLTEEWLLKFGFEKHARMVVFKNIKLSYWVKDAVCLFFNGSPPENTYLLGIGFNIGNDYYAATTVWIDKVHELQNAFFAFKGKEL